VVFDEQDRRVLAELEWNLSVGDPEFVSRFERRQGQMSAQRSRRLGNRIALSIAVAVGIALLLIGAPEGALAAVVTTGAVWSAWRFPNVFTGPPPS
jgi:hypothetical protein